MKRQVGWMPNAVLAAELGITPLDPDYLMSVETVEDEGGINPLFVGRLIPVWVEE